MALFQQSQSASKNWSRQIGVVGWVLLVLLAIVHFGFVYHYSVNVPYWDEWGALDSTALAKTLNFDWLLSFHNEHRIVFTHLLTWILFRLDHWNLVTQQVINFILFLFMLGSLCFVQLKSLGSKVFLVFPFFVAFLLSSIASENHTWGFQSQFHFVLIFLIWAIYFGFVCPPSMVTRILLGIALIAGMYSFSSGIPIALTLFIFYVLQSIALNEPKKYVGILAVMIFSALLAWQHGFVHPSGHPHFTFPFRDSFWIYYFTLLGNGFGSCNSKKLAGFIAFSLFLIPAIGLFLCPSKRLLRSTWTWVALGAAILSSLMVITVGRAGFGSGQARSPRYAEFSSLMVPITALLWWLWLENQDRWRKIALFGIFIFATSGYRLDWNFSHVYQEVYDQRMESRECIRKFYLDQGNGSCPTAYPVPIAEWLRRAQDLGISFAQETSGTGPRLKHQTL